MLDSNHTSRISREPIADFKSVWNQDETETGYVSRISHRTLFRHKDNSAIKEIRNFGPALPVSGEMLDSNHTSRISREPIADFKSVWNQDETETGYVSRISHRTL
ncbi:unnamed protein product [Brassica rapa subsp. narinosa]